MTILDKAISYFSPSAALRREVAKVALDHVRAYDAGKTGRKTEGWITTSGTETAEIWGSKQAKIRARAKDLFRNNEYAKAGIRALCSSTIRTGIGVYPKLKSERQKWESWAQSTDCDYNGKLDFAGIQLLVAQTVFVDGECLIIAHINPSKSFPLELQILEPDHLDDNKTGPENDGGYSLMGVKHNKFGKVDGYWIYPMHPGEVGVIRSDLTSMLVPASRVLHIFKKDRASAVRGVSVLSAAMMRLRDLADYDDATLVRKKIEACFAAFVTTDDGDSVTGSIQSDPRGGNQKTERLAPGLIKYLRPGQDVTFSNPSLSNDESFRRENLLAVSTSMGVTYAQLTGDLRQANYSSTRVGLVEHALHVEQWIWLVFVPQLINPVRSLWRETAMLAGVKTGKEKDAVVAPKRPWVDPYKDAIAEELMVKAGFKSGRRVIQEMGENPDDMLDDIAEWNELAKSKGVVLGANPLASILKINPLEEGQDADKSD